MAEMITFGSETFSLRKQKLERSKMRQVMIRTLPLWLAIAAACGQAIAEDPYTVEWTRQIGTSSNDESFSVAIDASGNVYISGRTAGDLEGTNAGINDVFLTKFDSSGNELWGKQIGTSLHDESYSVTVDSSGNAYISGYTQGDLEGTNAGGADVFLTKLDTSGNELWTEQIGTIRDENVHSVAVDASGNAYISGYTDGDLGGTNAGSLDAFLTKFDSSGNELWTQQIGTDNIDGSYSVAVDSAGNAYISGVTSGGLEGPNAGRSDAFLTKFDSSGNELWGKQIGTSGNDRSHSVAVDSAGNVYISGSTAGDLEGTNAGNYDAYLTKFDSSGNELWGKQIGSSFTDISNSVVVDSSGNAYISGYTEGDLEGTFAGSYEAFLTKFDSSGTELWTQQIGTSSNDISESVAVDSSGNAYISGFTQGDLEGTNAGGNDAFLVKFSPSAAVPEPSSLALVAVGACPLLLRRRRRVSSIGVAAMTVARRQT